MHGWQARARGAVACSRVQSRAVVCVHACACVVERRERWGCEECGVGGDGMTGRRVTANRRQVTREEGNGGNAGPWEVGVDGWRFDATRQPTLNVSN